MPKVLYPACWSKVRRAHEHQTALKSMFEEHFSTEENRPHFKSKREPYPFQHILYVSDVPPTLTSMLRQTGLLIGDTIYNLRAALDYLAYQLAVRNGPLTRRERESIYFPIHTRTGWRSWEQRYIRVFGASNTTLIKSFQPYRGVTRTKANRVCRLHPLTTLQMLSNRDKHRAPTVVAALPNTFSISFPPGVEVGAELGRPFGPGQPAYVGPTGNVLDFRKLRVRGGLKLNTEFGRVRLAGPGVPDNVQMDGTITPDIAFPDGVLVLNALAEMSISVFKILEAFDPIP